MAVPRGCICRVRDSTRGFLSHGLFGGCEILTADPASLFRFPEADSDLRCGHADYCLGVNYMLGE